MVHVKLDNLKACYNELIMVGKLYHGYWIETSFEEIMKCKYFRKDKRYQKEKDILIFN